MPPLALTHATLAKEDVFNTRSEADAYVPQGHSSRSNVNVTTAHTTRKPHATVPDPLPTHRRQTTNPVPDVVSATW
jgi:hypothetical protein